MKPILLCEGADGAFLPTTGYCRQGEKVWFAFGKPNTLDESFKGMQLVESIDGMDLEERQLPDGRKVKMPKGGVWVVEGPAQASDKRNANQRYYPREIWEKWIKNPQSDAQRAIAERAMVGHLEHPADGRTDGNKLAMVVTHAELRENGDVHARFELLDTPEGLRLQEYTRKGVKWGVSSRGTGSVDEKGRVSPSDYVLETWDAVMRPSVSGAHPRLTQSESDDPTPARGSVAEDSSSGSPATLGSDVASCVESVVSLCGSSIDELDETERRDLRVSLLRATRQLRTAPADKRVQDAMSRALGKLLVLEEIGTDQLDDLIESAVRDATQSDDATAGTDAAEAIQGLREAHRQTAEEAEELRAKLEAAESGLLSANWREQELLGQLAEANANREAIATQLATAQALLAERPAREVSGHVQEAIDEAVGQVAKLDEFRDILEAASSVDEVWDFAERLLPLAVRNVVAAVGSPLQPAAPIVEDSRPTLPRGAVRSEDDAGKRIEESRRAPSSRGARLAAAVVAVARK